MGILYEGDRVCTFFLKETCWLSESRWLNAERKCQVSAFKKEKIPVRKLMGGPPPPPPPAVTFPMGSACFINEFIILNQVEKKIEIISPNKKNLSCSIMIFI